MAWLFSKRCKKGLQEKKLRVSIPRRVRQRIWMVLTNLNEPTYAPDAFTNFDRQSSVIAELPSRIKAEFGFEDLMAFQDDDNGPLVVSDLKAFILRGRYPSNVFDAAELFYQAISEKAKVELQRSLNEIMEENNMAWRMAEGKIFPVDSHYIDEVVVRRSEELLKEATFLGALQEFEKARTDLANGDCQGAIQNANLAVESVVKGITGIERAKPGELFRLLIDSKLVPEYYTGFLQSFEKNILRCVAIMRNEESGAGHGQGPQVHEVPSELAELAVNLSAVLINYLLKKHIGNTGRSEQAPPGISEEDEIPF